MQASVLTHPRALTTADGIRERTGFSLSALPILVQRTDELRKAFLAQIFAVLVYCINKQGKNVVAQIMSSLKETRRQEAIRTIHRYRHLIHSNTTNG